MAIGQGSWRTRHLRVRAKCLKEPYESGHIIPVYCPGVAQAADLLTKALPSARISELLAILGSVAAQHSAPRGSGGSLHTPHCWRRCALSITHCNVCLEESPNGRWSSWFKRFKRFKRSTIHHILHCMLRGVSQWSLVLVVKTAQTV